MTIRRLKIAFAQSILRGKILFHQSIDKLRRNPIRMGVKNWA
ncbi:hypothetical protein VDG1235_3074 [Verrucomicrobiia bacterium DG1235]|nr:hypothetical protein VDG1235_3074 [Verrucomicrobiae bacterium DG1235]